MNEILSSPIPALARASVCLAIAAVLIEVAIRASRLRSAFVAQVLWFLVLAQGLVLVTIGLPIAPRKQAADPPLASAPATSVAPMVADEFHRQETLGDVSTGNKEHSTAAPARSPAVFAATASPLPWRSVVLLVWGAGIALLVLAGTARYVTFARRVCRTRPGRLEWQAEWRELLAANGLREDVPLAIDDRIGPLLCRLPLGYRLVVPDSLWNELSPDERRAVLVHELAHLRRGDLWFSFIASLMTLPHWFNPFAWWAYFRFERCAEWACDEAAAETSGKGIYARALMRLGSAGRFTAALTTSARSGRLFGRIRRILTEQREDDRAMKKRLLVGFACCLLLIAGLRLEPRAVLGEPAEIHAKAVPDESLPENALVQLGSDRLRQRSSVQQVAYSPDGRLIAARGINNDSGVHLWDARNGRHVRHLNREIKWGWVKDFAFSPDGKSIVATWIDKGLTLWDVSTGRLRWEVAGSEAKAKSVAFAPDAHAIAVGSPDGSVVLRQADDGELIRQIAPALERVFSTGAFSAPPREPAGETVLTFSPDGSQLVRGVKSPPAITVFDVATGDIVSEIEQAHGAGNARVGLLGPALQWLTIAPDGMQIVSTGYRNVPRENLKQQYRVKNVNIAEIRVWEVETGRRLKDLSGENVGNSFGFAALAPDSQTLALATMGSLRLWNLEREELVRDIDVPGWWGEAPAFAPDGRRVIAGVGDSIAVWNVATGERLLNGNAAHERMVATVAYSPDGRTVATGGGGTVRIWDAESARQRLVRRLGRDAHVYDVAFTPDGRLLIAAGRRDDVESSGGVVRFWDADSGDLVREIRTGEGDRVGGAALVIAVSPDGQQLGIAEARSNSRKIQLWDTDTGRRLAMYPPGDGLVWQISDLQFSPDGRYLWSASEDSQVHRWDTQGEDHFSFVADWRPPDQRDPKRWPEAFQATFTSDARTLVTVPITKVLHFWDTATGDLRFRLGLPGVEKGARFGLSPDGETIAVTDVIYAGEPGEDIITLWNIPSQTVRLALRPKDARAMSFAFSPDGKRLLTGFDRGTSIIWDVEAADQ